MTDADAPPRRRAADDRRPRRAHRAPGRPFHPIAGRLLGFGMLPLIALAGSLLLIPLVTRAAGPVGWGAIATGQALGAVAATLVQFGWAVMGPPKVAGADDAAARGIYFTSALMRGLLYVLSLPLLVLLCALIVPPEWYLPATALASSVALSGMSSAWYFIGRGAPRGLIALEVGPRLGGTALSAVLLLTGAGIGAYVAVAVVTEVVIAGIVLGVLARPTSSIREHLRAVGEATRAQWPLAASSLLALGYQRAAVPIVAGASPPAAPIYATADRAQAYGRLPLGPVVQALQKWVYDGRSRAEAGEFARRARLASAALAVSSIGIGVVIVLLLPMASNVFFGPALELGVSAAVPIAVSVVAVGASLALTTFILVPVGRIAVVTWSGVAASVVAAPGIWFAAQDWGAPGALWAVAAAEIGVAVAQGIAARSTLRLER